MPSAESSRRSIPESSGSRDITQAQLWEQRERQPQILGFSHSTEGPEYILRVAELSQIEHVRPPSETAIIDGPSLAYHIYHIARRRTLTRREHGAVDATPSYASILAILPNWLRVLENHGLIIHAIIFDGALPSNKQIIRRERMQKLCDQTKTFKEKWRRDERCLLDVVHEPDHFNWNITDQDLFTTNLPSRSPGFPALPFLVIAVIEYLKQSPWSAVTRIVPHEADEYCADEARKTGGIIFSSDTDYMGMPLGNGSVTSFQDVELKSGFKSILRALLYQPSSIARQLKLTPIGWHRLVNIELVYNDQYSFSNCLARCRSEQWVGEADSEQRARLEREMNEAYKHRPLPENVHELPLSWNAFLQGLEPRLSEFFVQSCEWNRPGRLSDVPDIFLPHLYEHPGRGAPFNHGKKIRKAAYALVTPKRAGSVGEWYRKGAEVKRQSVELTSPEEVLGKRTTLVEDIKFIRTFVSADQFDDLNGRELSLAWMCYEFYHTDKPIPSKAELGIIYTLNGAADWDTLHLQAQYQAILCSFRILTQVLHAFLLVHDVEDLNNQAFQLHTELLSIEGFGVLEMFDCLPSVETAKPRFGNLVDSIAKMINRLVDAEQPDIQQRTETMRAGKKKRARAAEQKAKARVAASDSRNRFNVLLALEGSDDI